MSNQILLMAMLILPWLTLFFMKKEDIKAYMPVALLSIVISVIIGEMAHTLKLWEVKETLYPLKSPSFLFGLNPVMTMWIFKATYQRFLFFVIVEVITNLGFSFLFIEKFLQNRGIMQTLNFSPIKGTILATLHGLILYGFQMWQDDIFKRNKIW